VRHRPSRLGSAGGVGRSVGEGHRDGCAGRPDADQRQAPADVGHGSTRRHLGHVRGARLLLLHRRRPARDRGRGRDLVAVRRAGGGGGLPAVRRTAQPGAAARSLGRADRRRRAQRVARVNSWPVAAWPAIRCRELRVRLKALVSALAVVVALPAGASASTGTLGLAGWQVQSSAQASQAGSAITSPTFDTGSWLHIRPDAAGAPGTEVAALVQAGRCPNVFFSTNMKNCFGYMSRVGSNTIPMFQVPWWFRTTFVSRLTSSEHAQLIVNGVVGEADVWLN